MSGFPIRIIVIMVALLLAVTKAMASFYPYDDGWRRTRPSPAGTKYGSVITSYYGGGERLNAHTATGEIFRPDGLTAAHRTLPFGTRLLVSHAGRSVVVRVNDRGPAASTGRSLDLSRGAAARLGLLQRGTGRVTMQVLP